MKSPSDTQNSTRNQAPLPSITAIICTLNEEQTISHVLENIPSFITDVLIVDGNSNDNTIMVIQKAYPSVRITTQPGKGKGDAIRHGIREAKGQIIVTLDADGSMDPSDIIKFVESLTEGSDYAKGSRFLPGVRTDDMPRHRLFGNWVFTTLTNILFGSKYTDITYGFNAFWKEKIQNIKVHSDGFEEVVEWNINVHRHGLKVQEVAVDEYERLDGEAKLRSFHDGARILKTILRERIRRQSTNQKD